MELACSVKLKAVGFAEGVGRRDMAKTDILLSLCHHSKHLSIHSQETCPLLKQQKYLSASRDTLTTKLTGQLVSRSAGFTKPLTPPVVSPSSEAVSYYRGRALTVVSLIFQ